MTDAAVIGLYARGIGWHAPEIIEAKGRQDIKALSDFLGDREFLVTDRPVTADAAIFGQLAPMLVWPMDTPVARYLRTVPNLVAYRERMCARCFGMQAREAQVEEAPLLHHERTRHG